VNHRIIVLILAISMIAIVGGCEAASTNREAAATTANTNTAARTDVKKPTVDEIREVLAAHDKALNDKNLDAIMATFSTEPTTVMLGTGSEERWMGPQEIRAAYTEIIKDYDPGTLDAKCDWKTGGSDEHGEMAWLAAVCDCKDSLQGKVRTYKLNVTATVAKQNNQWKFVSLHMSNAFQPPVSK
jgi:ketosteroid isomerase-like protein